MQAYFANLESALKKKMEEKPTARRKFVYEIAKVGNRLFEEDWSSAWTTVFVPFEILNSMNVAGMFVEFVGAMLAGAGLSRPYFEKAESAGFSTDGCSYHRTVIGAAMERLLPPPDVLVGATFPCMGGVKALKRVGELYDVPVFVINVPYDDSPESVEYLVGQYKAMIDHVAEATGRKLDQGRLKRAMELTNEARRYLLEVEELAKRVPSPVGPNDLKNFIINVLLLGTPAGVEVARAFRDELRDRVERGAAGLPNERYRLLWIQNRIQFRTSLLDELARRHGANVVVDELNHVYWGEMDPDDPLRSIAVRAVTHPLVGPARRRVEVLLKLAREYRVDGVVNPSHWGCRQNGGARGLFKEALQAAGVPYVNLDVDCVDERNYSEAQLLTRLEAFLEVL